MNKINFIFVSISILFCLAISTILIEDLDIIVAAYFYQNPGFYKTKSLIFIHKLIPILIISLVSAFIIILLYSHFVKNFELRKRILYLILCLVIGPGLIVNTIFKENFGRARPNQIIEFGGTKKHTPPFTISKECVKNCSFVSGHASVGFYTTAFAYVINSRFNHKTYLIGLIIGLITGIARIMQGGHFLSDVLFSGLFVIILNHLLYKIFYRNIRNYNEQRKS